MKAPLDVGTRIPDFSAYDQDSRTWTQKDLEGKLTVMYFYPKDETPGCVAESCSFRDNWAQFQSLDVQVLGVSRDGRESHRKFKESRELPFTLLTDRGGEMAKAYGALMLLGLPRRVSYLVGPDLRVLAMHDSRLRPTSHVPAMLDAARAAKA